MALGLMGRVGRLHEIEGIEKYRNARSIDKPESGSGVIHDCFLGGGLKLEEQDNPHNPDHTEAQLRREQSALAQTAPSGIFCIFSVCCMQARGRTKTETEGPSQMTKQEALGHLAGERAVMYTTDTGNIVPEPSVGLTRVPFSNTVVRAKVRSSTCSDNRFEESRFQWAAWKIYSVPVAVYSIILSVYCQYILYA